ncbi:hypothetical protein CTAYLR_007078 [Chrysophaeum taylorii]|uniref:WW domain-containing protein n=1 Tax=Chrysophaeum taylorii TaxID=2483200 RepID=A0AAD7UK72_9STRA|nr:hypothetical protein CTAYLR_007078 [Chrysophaeum taylorii]
MEGPPSNAVVEIEQSNPKREGSKSHVRYESYKRAKTVREYYELGGSKADLTHDMKRGFVTVVTDASGATVTSGEAVPEQRSEASAEAPADTVPWNDSPYVDDLCDTCGLPTITEYGDAMRNVLICETCECEAHLKCAGLTKVPKDAWNCGECVAFKARGSERPRAAGPPPKAEEHAQLGTRCVECGSPGSPDAALFFCDSVDCFGVYHLSCCIGALKPIEEKEAFDGDPESVTLEQLQRATKCPRCRLRTTDEIEQWRLLVEEEVDLVERARLHAIALGQARDLTPDLLRACLSEFATPAGPPAPAPHDPPQPNDDDPDYASSRHQTDDDGNNNANLPPPPPPPPLATPRSPNPECYKVGRGWWCKHDPATGNMFYVHEVTGQTQWETPAALDKYVT